MGNFGGSLGGHFTLHADVYEISVNTGANTSTVRMDLYIQCDSTGTGLFDLTGDSSWSASVNGNGASGNFNYDFRGNANTIHLATYDTVVGHDNNGDATIGWSANANMQNSPYVTTAGISGTLGLTHINRYSNVTSFTVTNITDEGFTLSASCDTTASTINFSLDNGGTYSGGGSGTSASQTFHNLISGHTYSCYAHTVNSASGLNAYSGNIQAVTLVQNKFFKTGIV